MYWIEYKWGLSTYLQTAVVLCEAPALSMLRRLTNLTFGWSSFFISNLSMLMGALIFDQTKDSVLSLSKGLGVVVLGHWNDLFNAQL